MFNNEKFQTFILTHSEAVDDYLTRYGDIFIYLLMLPRDIILRQTNMFKFEY